jgi:hypothetical protein
VFSSWYAWENRQRFPQQDYPGVYLMAISPRTDLEGTPPDWRDVVYIGMTNSQGGLAARWRQFNRSIHGNRGHSGGKTAFAALGPYPSWTDCLYVAGMAVPCDVLTPGRDDYLRMGWVAFYEYEAFARYCEAVGGHPRYNQK